MRSQASSVVIKLFATLALALHGPQTVTAQSIESPQSSDSPSAFEPLRGHSETIHTLAYTPDGRTLIMPVVYNWLHLKDEKELTEGVVATARDTIENELSRIR